MFKKMWPTAGGATQKTKNKNVKIRLPSTRQKREFYLESYFWDICPF